MKYRKIGHYTKGIIILNYALYLFIGILLYPYGYWYLYGELIVVGFYEMFYKWHLFNKSEQEVQHNGKSNGKS